MRALILVRRVGVILVHVCVCGVGGGGCIKGKQLSWCAVMYTGTLFWVPQAQAFRVVSVRGIKTDVGVKDNTLKHM